MHKLTRYKFLNLFLFSCALLINSAVNATTLYTSANIIPNALPDTTMQPRVALVLGGGGARGAAHLGVISVLERAGIPIDLIVGTSIGSLVGALYADDPRASDVSQIMFNTPRKQLLNFSLFNLFNGPFSNEGIENYVLEKVPAKQFKDLKIKYIAVATDLNSGQTVPLYTGQINSAVAASMALPPFFPALNVNGRTLIDGGMSDPVPVDIAKLYRPKVIIAVSIAESVSPTISSFTAMSNYKRAEVIRKANFDKLSARDASVFIHPDVGQTGVFDNSHEYLLAQNGIKAAQQALPQICALLKANHIKSNCDAALKQLN